MTGGALTYVLLTLAVGRGGQPEVPKPPQVAQTQPLTPFAPTLSPVFEHPGLPGAPHAFMDPRTYAWQQHRIPPADQLDGCGACAGGAGCLGDRRQRNLTDRVCDFVRKIHYWRIGIPTGPQGTSAPAGLDQDIVASPEEPGVHPRSTPAPAFLDQRCVILRP